MAQKEFLELTAQGKKRVTVTGVAGPSSYAANGFTVRVNSLRSIDNVLSITPTTGRATADTNQVYNLSTITGNSFLVKVMTQTVTASSGNATWAELADAQNISTVIFTFVVLGD